MWTIWETLAFAVWLLAAFMAYHAPLNWFPISTNPSFWQWDWGGFTGSIIGAVIAGIAIWIGTQQQRIEARGKRADRISDAQARVTQLLQFLGAAHPVALTEYNDIGGQAYRKTDIELILRQHPEKTVREHKNYFKDKNGTELYDLITLVFSYPNDFDSRIIKSVMELRDLVSMAKSVSSLITTSYTKRSTWIEGQQQIDVNWREDIFGALEEAVRVRRMISATLIAIRAYANAQRDSFMKEFAGMHDRF